MIILGIDPGSYKVGYGLLNVRGHEWTVLDYGLIRAPSSLSFPLRLKCIYDQIAALMDRHHPEAVAVESVFVSKNVKTSLTLGHTRGVILLAAANRDLAVGEYAPRDIKQAVTGNGAADKSQVQWMMSRLLHIETAELEENAADGLAVALCHGLRNQSKPGMP